MKRIIVITVIAIIGVTAGVWVAHSGNSTPHHSASYEAGVAWVRNGFPGSNQNDCGNSVLVPFNSPNCNPTSMPCASAAAAIALLNYNMQQWIDGCLSVPFKYYPKWFKQTVYNANN